RWCLPSLGERVTEKVCRPPSPVGPGRNVPMKTRRLLVPVAIGAVLLGSAAVASTALAVTGPPPAPAPLISKLSVKDKANASHWSIQAGLKKGKKVYGDRTVTFTAVPAPLVAPPCIPAPDKSN